MDQLKLLNGVKAASDNLYLTAARTLYLHTNRIKRSATQATGDENIEHVHQFRVSAGRLRCAIKLFESFIDYRYFSLIRRELAWAGKSMAAVRDRDIIRLHLESERFKKVNNALCKELHESNLRLRRPAFDAMVCAVQSKRFENMAGLLEKTYTDILGLRDYGAIAYEYSLFLLSKLMRKVRKRGKKDIFKMKKSAIHKLRIVIKRARYGCEFFEHYYKGNIQTTIKYLKHMQQALGDYNDCMVMVDFLKSGEHGLERKVLKPFIRIEKKEAALCLRRFNKAYKKFPCKLVLK